MSEDDVYSVSAIRYGRYDRRSPVNYIGGDPHDILQPLDDWPWAPSAIARSSSLLMRA
jgi:hypothetical protein